MWWITCATPSVGVCLSVCLSLQDGDGDDDMDEVWLAVSPSMYPLSSAPVVVCGCCCMICLFVPYASWLNLSTMQCMDLHPIHIASQSSTEQCMRVCVHVRMSYVHSLYLRIAQLTIMRLMWCGCSAFGAVILPLAGDLHLSHCVSDINCSPAPPRVNTYPC